MLAKVYSAAVCGVDAFEVEIEVNAARGNPVIVRIHLPNGLTHFVVIVGKAGFDYLIQDPASGGVHGIYPLWKLASEIEALRFYEKLTLASPSGGGRPTQASEMTNRN